jgi:hypothetical protein
MSIWNLLYFTSGIYVAQKFPNSVPNIKSKVDEISNLIINSPEFSYREILKIICKK